MIHQPDWRLLVRGAALVVFLLGMTSTPANAQSPRYTIAFADFEQVFTNYFKTKLANDQLQEMLDAMNRERAILVIQFDQTQADIKALRAKLVEESNDTKREGLRRSIDEKIIELRKIEDRTKRFNETQEKRWEEQHQRIRTTLMKEVKSKSSRLIKSRGYSAVLDSSLVSDKGVPTVFYLDPAADITADIIAEINK